MVNSEKNPHFEPLRHGIANSIADLASVHILKINASRGEADLHVVNIASEAIGENRFGTLMIAVCAMEIISAYPRSWFSKWAKLSYRKSGFQDAGGKRYLPGLAF